MDKNEFVAERALNVGCSDSSRWIPNTEGLDVIDHGQKWVTDVMEFEPPYKYNAVFMHHVVEHFDNPVELMDKVIDFLEPEGVVDIRVPVLPYEQAFLDPTHKVFIPSERWFYYFTENSPSGHCYTKKKFKILGVEHDRFEWELHIVLQLIE